MQILEGTGILHAPVIYSRIEVSGSAKLLRSRSKKNNSKENCGDDNDTFSIFRNRTGSDI